MKEKFWGYIPLDEQDFKEIWKDSKIVLDTNILLNLYRYSESTQKEVLRVLEEKKERFIIPNIVIKEFFENRDEEIEKHCYIRDTVYNDMQINRMRDAVKKYRHLSLDTEQLLKIIDDFEKKINDFLKKCKTEDFFKKDPIIEKIVKWFDDKVIDNLTEDDLKEIYEEGEQRYSKKIPPGYEDAKTKKNNRKYNDLVIWKQIIKYAFDNGTNILFISDDLKTDWIKEIKGEKKGPREELLNEFYIKTNGQKIYIYSTTGFLNAYSKYNGTTKEVDKQTIYEVEEVEREILEKIDKSFKYIKFSDQFESKCNENIIRNNKYNTINSSNFGSLNNKYKFILYKTINDLIFIKNEYFDDDDFCYNNENYKKLISMEKKLNHLYSEASEHGEGKIMELIDSALNEVKSLQNEVIPF